jgi:hypothetical protein
MGVQSVNFCRNKTTNERYARRAATVSNDESFIEEGSFDDTIKMEQTTIV